MSTPKEITVDGVTYRAVPDTSDEWVMVRSAQAGVFAGRKVSRRDTEVELADARRIWYWAGAATLSQLATDGTSKPDDCKFPPAVPSILVLGVCEIIPMTERAVKSINSVREWRR